jgi:hypothetical protein
MPPLLLIIKNICIKGKVSQEAMDNIQDIEEILNEVIVEFPN